MSFADLGVAPDMVAALAKLGITTPTPIQALALPALTADGDVYLTSETGTGKTLAYLLPLLGGLDLALPAAQAIVLAPTHELALQIHRACCDLAQHARRPVRTLLLIGGTPIARQLDKLKAKPHVVVGSPGRVRELMDLGKLKTPDVRTLVVDEADRLMAGQEAPIVSAIAQRLRRERRLVFVSATEQPASTEAIAALAPAVKRLRPADAPAVNADITHTYLVCEERDKPKVLRQLLHAVRPERALVFAHLNETAARVAAQLAHHGVAAVELHAGVDKAARKQAMDAFRTGDARVMVASDVAARGLDLPGVALVVQLDAPNESRAYLHRAGRTGRAGAPGLAVTLMTDRDRRLAERYPRELGIPLTRVRLREGRLLEVREGTPRG